MGALAGALIAVLLTVGAAAQDFPSEPIRMIVRPGPDIVARIFGQKLTDAWGQQMLIDTRPRGGGTIAAETMATSPPDGYTLPLASASYTINAVLQPGSYELFRDFAAVAFAASSRFLFRSSVGARAVRERVHRG